MRTKDGHNWYNNGTKFVYYNGIKQKKKFYKCSEWEKGCPAKMRYFICSGQMEFINDHIHPASYHETISSPIRTTKSSSLNKLVHKSDTLNDRLELMKSQISYEVETSVKQHIMTEMHEIERLKKDYELMNEQVFKLKAQCESNKTDIEHLKQRQDKLEEKISDCVIQVEIGKKNLVEMIDRESTHHNQSLKEMINKQKSSIIKNEQEQQENYKKINTMIDSLKQRILGNEATCTKLQEGYENWLVSCFMNKMD